MNKVINFLCVITILSSCSVTKNWKSTQDVFYWNAKFDDFNGKEIINIESKKNKISYINSSFINKSGDLKLLINGVEDTSDLKVIHKKTSLDQPVEIKIIGYKTTGSFKIRYPEFQIKKVVVSCNPNIELFGLCYFLTEYDHFSSIPEDLFFDINGQKISAKKRLSLNMKIADEFKKFRNSKNFKIIKSYFDKSFYLNYSSFIVGLDSFPHASVNKNNEFLYMFESIEDAKRLVNALNKFYNEINFQEYLLKYNIYYKKVIEEVEKSIPSENFIIEMEHLYNEEFDSYNLYPSLTISAGQACGVKNKNTIGNIFTLFDYPKEIDNIKGLQLGFNNKVSLRNICIHEFGHSFVNPIIDKIDNGVINMTSHLFNPIKDNLTNQGYNTWRICLYEHFVRANEVIIAKLLNDYEMADKIFKDNIQNKSFVYLPQIVEKLEYWYYNEFITKTYQEKVNEIIAELK